MPPSGTQVELANGVLLAASGLGKRFGGPWIFRNLEFEVRRGEGLIVVGRNGSGKTTLLKTLAGLLTPDEGSLRLAPMEPRRGLQLAALDQSLYPQLTVREHFEFFARMRGCLDRTDELLGRVGLADAVDRFAARLSTGMRNRLKLALAIQPNPEILLLDEPGAGLDEAGKELVAGICGEQKIRGALIVATNDPSEGRFGTHELELA